jgi:hypothetical protein
MIVAIQRELVGELKDKFKSTNKLLEHQLQLYRELKASVPDFIPCLEADWQRVPTASTSEHLFLDKLHAELMKSGNARFRRPNVSQAQHETILAYNRSWVDICVNYNNNVWVAVMDIATAIVHRVCKGKPVSPQEMLRLLDQHMAAFRQRADDFLRVVAENETDDPSYIDGFLDEMEGPANDLAAVLFPRFQQKYRMPDREQEPTTPQRGHNTPPNSPARRDRLAQPLTVVNSKTLPGPIGIATRTTRLLPPSTAATPAEWSDAYAYDIVHLGATVIRHLQWGHRSLARQVGRHVQSLARKYVASIARPLWDGLQLSRVDERGRKRTGPDEETVRKRKATANKKRKLQHLE